MFTLIYKLSRRLSGVVFGVFSFCSTYLRLKGNGVQFKSFKTNGRPYVMVSRGGAFKIGDNFSMTNGIKGNPIGCYNPCTFFVGKSGLLAIGNNVGISQTALICHDKITIGNDVKIGGGVRIYDTDFHSLDPEIRKGPDDMKFKACAPVEIRDGAFLGAYCIVLKGVTVGRNSIVGAGSIVTKSIPDNEIWAGNPAKFIRTI